MCLVTDADRRAAELVAFVDEYDRHAAQLRQNIHTAIRRLQDQLAADAISPPAQFFDHPPPGEDYRRLLESMMARFL